MTDENVKPQVGERDPRVATPTDDAFTAKPAEALESTTAEPVKLQYTTRPRPAKKKLRPCRIKGCEEPAKHQATGYCVEHYRRWLNAQRAGVR